MGFTSTHVKKQPNDDSTNSHAAIAKEKEQSADTKWKKRCVKSMPASHEWVNPDAQQSAGVVKIERGGGQICPLKRKLISSEGSSAREPWAKDLSGTIHECQRWEKKTKKCDDEKVVEWMNPGNHYIVVLGM